MAALEARLGPRFKTHRVDVRDACCGLYLGERLLVGRHLVGRDRNRGFVLADDPRALRHLALQLALLLDCEVPALAALAADARRVVAGVQRCLVRAAVVLDRLAHGLPLPLKRVGVALRADLQCSHVRLHRVTCAVRVVCLIR